MKIRVGFGFDVHQLVEGRELWLGGILLEHTKGLLGHSDADVLLHAVCDALLGAANMRDIGYHFPDTAGEFKNIDSKILLKKTVELIATKGYKAVSYTHLTGDYAVVIALKCETDFVAQNADFVKLTQDILDLAVANKCKTLEEVKAWPMGNGTVQDLSLIHISGVISL